MTVVKGYPFAGDFRISLPFGVAGEAWVSKTHLGMDLVGVGNTDVLAVDDGTVIYTRTSTSGYGKHIFIAHHDKTSTLYAHLASFNVKPGDKISRGQKIGVMGATGNAYGAHLHLECRNVTYYKYGKNVVDPAIYLGLPTKQKGAVICGETNPATGYRTAESGDGALKTDYLDVLAGDGTQYQKTGEIKKGEFLYGRRYRILVSTGKGNALDVSDLHCKFQIVKTAYMEPNTSYVTIYNLSPNTENAIIKEGQEFIVEAGYTGNQYGMIFRGNVVQPLRAKEDGTTYTLKLIGMDGDAYLTYGMVGISMVAGQTSRSVLEACASTATIPMPLGDVSDFSGVQLPRGKVLFGMSRDYIRQIAQTENASFSIQNNEIRVVKADALPKDEIFYLDTESGLIGTPSQTEQGMSCKMLLNPRIEIGSLISIDNSKISAMAWSYGKTLRALDQEGIYRVIKVTHTGDTRGNDWYTQVETISQAGINALPELMENENTYIY